MMQLNIAHSVNGIALMPVLRRPIRTRNHKSMKNGQKCISFYRKPVFAAPQQLLNGFFKSQLDPNTIKYQGRANLDGLCRRQRSPLVGIDHTDPLRKASTGRNQAIDPPRGLQHVKPTHRCDYPLADLTVNPFVRKLVSANLVPAKAECGFGCPGVTEPDFPASQKRQPSAQHGESLAVPNWSIELKRLKPEWPASIGNRGGLHHGIAACNCL